jgi:hypothetical protein
VTWTALRLGAALRAGEVTAGRLIVGRRSAGRRGQPWQDQVTLAAAPRVEACA